MFSDADFEEKTLSISQEEKFIRYLLTLQQAMLKLNAKSEHYSQNCCPHYIARGMGLVTGEQNKNTTFYVYSTSKSSLARDVIVSIRGPFATSATITIPAFRNSNLKQTNKRLVLENKQRKSFLGFMNSERSNNTIPLKVEMETDRAVVTFVPRHTGMYQVALSSNSDHLAGSPYNLRILKNESSDDTGSEMKKKHFLSKFAGCVDNKSSSLKETFLQKDDDFELSFASRSRTILIPHTGYAYKKIENVKELSPTITETRQIFQMKQTDDLVKCAPDKITSSICEMHIVPEEKSGEEIELCTFSAKENVTEQIQANNETKFEDAIEWKEIARPPKNLKAFIKEKKEYWDHLILMNTTNHSKSTPVHLNEPHKVELKPLAKELSKSLETLDKKLDFDWSVELSEIPSVRDRKSILIEQLTDEQKLLQMQNEKKRKNLQNERELLDKLHKGVRKPKRHESFSSVVDRIQMFNSGKFCVTLDGKPFVNGDYFQKNFVKNCKLQKKMMRKTKRKTLF